MPMVNFVPDTMGGTESVLRALLPVLAAQPGLDVTAYLSAAARFDGKAEVLHGVSGGKSLKDWARTRLQTLLRRSSLHRQIGAADLYAYPFTVPWPEPPRGIPRCVTVHDVQHLDLPELFSPQVRAFRALAYDRPPRTAQAVITVSEWAKERIATRLRIDPDKIHVAYNGVNRAAFTPNLGQRKHFALYPARGWPHKNHELLLRAWPQVRRAVPDLELVLTGGALDGIGPVPAGVTVRGLVSFAELIELYQQASVLVFPSRYEGFGMPVLEAMATGCPVACSTAGSLPEVCGDAAITFDPGDIDALAAAVVQALADTEQLQRRGLARVEAFTWQGCAEATERAYFAAVG